MIFMTEKLTDKVKEGIVESQIRRIQKGNNNAINYDVLRNYLAEGLENYLSQNSNVEIPEHKYISVLDEGVDWRLLREMEKDQGRKVVCRLKNSIRYYENLNRSDEQKNSHWLNFYNSMEKEIACPPRNFSLREYGKKSHEFLEEYLKKKELVK